MQFPCLKTNSHVTWTWAQTCWLKIVGNSVLNFFFFLQIVDIMNLFLRVFCCGKIDYQYLIAYTDSWQMSGGTNYQYDAGFLDVFPNYELVSSCKTWKFPTYSFFPLPWKLHRTPVNVTATNDSRNNLTTRMDSLQECAGGQIQFQGLGDHEWEARDKIANSSCRRKPKNAALFVISITEFREANCCDGKPRIDRDTHITRNHIF